jgi:tetratricopeptide (TPR) repeat protein
MMDRDDARRRAQTLARHNQVEAAIGEYLRLLKANPGDQAAANELGDLYVRAGRADLAAERYLEVARALHREGFFSRASGFYRKILKLQPQNAPVLVALGQALQSQRLLVEARKAFDEARAVVAAAGDATNAAAITAHLAALERVAAPPRPAQSPPAMAEPAPDPRRDLLRAVADLADRPVEADRADAGGDEWARGRPEQVEAPPPTSEGSPEDAEVQLGLARAFLEALLPDEAEALLLPLTADHARRVRAAAMLAEALDAQDRPGEAVEWLERVVQAPEVNDRDRLDAMRRLGALLERIGEPDRALAVWLELQAGQPDDAEAAAGIARLMNVAGRGGDPSTP